MNTKGSVLDVGFAAIAIFVFVIIAFIAYYSYSTVSAKMINNTQFNQSTAAVNALEDTQVVLNRLDYITLTLLIGFILGVIISGWMVGGNPVYSFIYFIVLVIFVVAASILSYTWNKISTMPIFTQTLGHFSVSNHILSNFPLYITIIGFIGMMVMFAKPYIGGGDEYV